MINAPVANHFYKGIYVISFTTVLLKKKHLMELGTLRYSLGSLINTKKISPLNGTQLMIISLSITEALYDFGLLLTGYFYVLLLLSIDTYY
jgi:hypothetical protein